MAENDRIGITSRYQPEPQTTHWLDQPGQVLWQQPLAAGASQRFGAEHVITWPRGMRLYGEEGANNGPAWPADVRHLTGQPGTCRRAWHSNRQSAKIPD